MRNLLKYIIPVLLLVGCSEETPSLTEKISISATFEISDVENWPKNQKIVFGLLEEGRSAAENTTVLVADGQNSYQATLHDVEVGTYQATLYVAQNNQWVADLWVKDHQQYDADTYLGSHPITLVSYARVQQQLFNNCTACHGASSGDPAAGLLLTAAASYENLVNVNAQNSNVQRVTPGDTAASFLVQVLKEEDLTFDHSASSIADDGDIELVEAWIRKGALRD